MKDFFISALILIPTIIYVNSSNTDQNTMTKINTICTIIYVICTYYILMETKKMSRYNIEPNIIIELIPDETTINNIDIYIENIGLGEAYDLNFSSDKDILLPTKRKISEIGLFKSKISRFYPKQTIKFSLINLCSIPKDNIEQYNFVIKISYKNKDGQKYEVECPINFSYLMYLPKVKPYSNVDALINKLQDISNKLDNLNVTVYSPNELEKERNAEIENAKKIFATMPEKIGFEVVQDNEKKEEKKS